MGETVGMGAGRIGTKARWQRSLATGLTTLALLLSACSSGAEETGERTGSTVDVEPVRGGELVVAMTSEGDGYNPIANRFSNASFMVARAVADPLVIMDRDNNWQPFLAQEITSNVDFTSWTIRLREGVTFHNGEPLDAEALALYLQASVTSPLTAAAMPEVPAVAAIDNMTVRVTFTRPWSSFPVLLADQPGYVIAPEQVRSGATDQMIGTGPFVFEEWTPDVRFRATRNENYWRDGADDEPLPYLDSIEFRPMPDTATRVAALRAGEVDVIDVIPMTTSDELVDDGFDRVDDVDVASTDVLIFNMDADGTSDPRMREAIVRAVDPGRMIEVVAPGSAEPATQPYPPESRWSTPTDYPRPDPAEATRLVEEFVGDGGDAAIDVLFIRSEATLDGGQFLQESLGSVGIDVTLDAIDAAAFIDRFVAGDYQTVYIPGFFGSADPDGIYHFLHSSMAEPPIALNFARHRNATTDEALDEQRTTEDSAAREESWATVWRTMADDLPYAFLAHRWVSLVTAPEVAGFEGYETPEGVPLPAINRWTYNFAPVYES